MLSYLETIRNGVPQSEMSTEGTQLLGFPAGTTFKVDFTIFFQPVRKLLNDA